MLARKRILKRYDKGPSFRELYQYKVLRDFMICAMLDTCHPDNKKPYREKKKEFLKAYHSEPF